MEGGTATPALQDNAGEAFRGLLPNHDVSTANPTPTAPNPPATAGSSSSPLFAVLELQVKAAAAVAREVHDVPLALALLQSVAAVLELEKTAEPAVARGVQVLLLAHLKSATTVLDEITKTDQTSRREAFSGLPSHVIIQHILGSDTDPVVLARLRAVSRLMRDVVDETGLRVEEMTAEVAAQNGFLDTLKNKLQKGRLDKQHMCENAALGGHLEVQQWARANGCPWYWQTCVRAALHGHLEVLQWASANGCPWDEETCSGAAKGGHLDMLQWARANGCPWDDWTCSGAARGGHLELMQWARANGCPWDENTRDAASRHILEWAVANGAE
jgi:hypothetical protein